MAELKRYRCANCGKTLFYGDLKAGSVVSKDCKCGLRNVVEGDHEYKKTVLLNIKSVA